MKTIKLITSLFLISIFFIPVLVSAEDASVGTIVKDAAITTQIKAKLLAADNIDSMQIKVETADNGDVVLTGAVKSEAEKEKVLNIVQAVDGVQNVLNKLVIDTNLR